MLFQVSVILTVVFLVNHANSDQHVCTLKCSAYFDGCQKCTHTTLICLGRGLTAVCASHFNETSTELYDVYLRDNKITDFSTFPNSTIKILNIAKNRITSLTKSDLERFPLLEQLWMDDNSIKSLPKDVFQGTIHIEALHMAGMGLTDLPTDVFKQTRALTFLDLSRNGFSSVPDKSFSPGNRITTLMLNDNPITSFGRSDFIQLKQLEILHLRALQITLIISETFSSLSRLKVIDLDFNSQLRFIDEDAFGWCSKRPGKYAASLSSVSIRSCGLSSLDQHTFNVMELESFRFIGNPWECDCSIQWLINKTKWEGARAKEVIVRELDSSRCDNDKWKGTPLSAVPVAELDETCYKPAQLLKFERPLTRLRSGDKAIEAKTFFELVMILRNFIA